MAQPLNPKIIVGCDASTRNIGWAIMKFKTEERIASGNVELQSSSFYDRLKTGPLLLIKELRVHVPDFRAIDMFAIEHSFFGTNQTTGKQITMMIGGICCAVQHKGITRIMEYSPTTIKAVFAGHGHSTKDDIREHVAMEFNVNLKSEDECDALAIASTYIIEYKSGALRRKASEKKWKQKKKTEKSAKTRAVKTGKPLPGELQL